MSRASGQDSAVHSFAMDAMTREKVARFQKRHSCRIPPGKRDGSIGGRFTYSFTPTSLGVAVRVKCACGKEKDVTDYDSW